VFNLDQVSWYVRTGVGGNPAAAFNTFSHARALTTPKDTFVTINNDTVFSMAQLDLSAGPVLLRVPDTAGRYYVLQFVDAWTNNFAYIGKRGTGTAAGSFLLVPPAWPGTAPADVTLVRFPTTVASIVVRWAVDGPEDLPAVHALQNATRLDPAGPISQAAGISAATGALSEAMTFFEKYRLWSQAFPPAARDMPTQEIVCAARSHRRRARRQARRAGHGSAGSRLCRRAGRRCGKPARRSCRGGQRLDANLPRFRLQPGFLRSRDDR
jgi:hypothetical protein